MSNSQEPWRENLNDVLICKDCQEFPPHIEEEFSSGDLVCGSCGLVLDNRIVDTRSEWRTFSNDDQGNDDPSRVGDAANPLLNGSQLATSISFSDGGSGRGKELHRAQNKATHDKATKSLLAAYKEIGALCDGFKVTKTVADTAKHYFKMTDDKKAFRGKAQDAVIAGCIFLACRSNNVSRSFNEIHRLTRVPKKDIGRMFKQLEVFFNKENAERAAKREKEGQHASIPGMDDYQSTHSTTAADLIARYSSSLGLSHRVGVVSEDLARKASSVGALAGRSPVSTAAACIYMISYLYGQGKTPKEIAANAGVSDGTIRTAYKFLYAEREQLIDPNWLGDGKGDMKNLPST
ncbi:MAG: transcription initiation factor IIB [Cirrosporium novae-zelandiae]|nr:MAG: transcription initiation factor IIB [Cirrosporium novae-zelandiae]